MVLSMLRPRLVPLRPALAPPAKRADPFYGSAEWKALVSGLIRLAGRVCSRCGRTRCRLYGDHIAELKDGGAPLDPRNVQLLCASCHAAKTAAARTARFGTNR